MLDAQYLLGNQVQIHRVEDAQIPLYVAAYSEVPIDIKEIGRRGKISLESLADYFGYVPMPHYTLCFEFLKPFSPDHGYGFSMEHLNSMTASFDTSRAIKRYDPDPPIGSMVHHIGHSWIPLRSYGTGYRPFEWGTAPIIETIWLNEGFIWYVMTIVLDDIKRLDFFRRVTKFAPDYIKRKSLKELSQLGSSQYSLDFNIGRNLFSRGALMAYEMDMEIQNNTEREKSFKDALLGLLEWTEKNQRPFHYEEIEPILSNTTGVDLKNIWEKWQKPMID
jgi:predicted metalloprotease with PDZ domain